jgi:uncharacterized protein (TIGR02246 family)
MPDDERRIRQLITDWMAASRAGDSAKVLSLMTDDVVFLRAGHPPMIGKERFAAEMTPRPNSPPPQVDGSVDIQEVQVCGDWAFIWTNLEVTVTPPGGAPMKRAGHTLTIFKKHNGQWLLARDANMLSPVT